MSAAGLAVMGTATEDRELRRIARRLGRIAHKPYELYAVSRIIHGLSDPEIEWVTQQVVRVPDGRHCFIDCYFPQFGLAVEVDEVFHLGQVDADADREATINRLIASAAQRDAEALLRARPSRETVDLIGDERTRFRRIGVLGADVAEFDRQTDAVVAEVRRSKAEAVASGTFTALRVGTRESAEHWRRQDVLKVHDLDMLRTHAAVASLFDRPGSQRAYWHLGGGIALWFPKLYPNALWSNELSRDGAAIVERPVDLDAPLVPPTGDLDPRLRIVFAHTSDEFGAVYYKFRGVFRMVDWTGGVRRYERTADEIVLSQWRERIRS